MKTGIAISRNLSKPTTTAYPRRKSRKGGQPPMPPDFHFPKDRSWTGRILTPYVFDGSMSIEDYELMHRMIEKERSERMDAPILSGYLSNLRKYCGRMGNIPHDLFCAVTSNFTV